MHLLNVLEVFVAVVLTVVTAVAETSAEVIDGTPGFGPSYLPTVPCGQSFRQWFPSQGPAPSQPA